MSNNYEMTNALSAEYIVWCDAQNLPAMSADELVRETEITTEAQRIWLSDFINRWEIAAAIEDGNARRFFD